MRLGEIVDDPLLWPSPSPLIKLAPPVDDAGSQPGSTIHATALQWLKEDREHRRELERAGRKVRGARRKTDGVDSTPTDSESFFKKYAFFEFFVYDRQVLIRSVSIQVRLFTLDFPVSSTAFNSIE